MPDVISIQLLADYPQLVAAVGEMRHKEWGDGSKQPNLQWWIDVSAHEAGRNALPVTWVAIDDRSRAVGAVGLAEFDLEERHDRSPWLIGMIVANALRRRGIGGMLVRELEGWARDRGYAEVWVATGQAVDFYRQRGWQFHERIERSSGEPNVLRRRL
jgi:GNAT superfamily N-acetyltransferase